MAKFSFRLQSFLSIKEKVEDQKKQEYGLAIAALEKEKLIMLKLQDERQYAIESFRETISSKSIDPMRVMTYNDYIELVKRKISKQEEVLRRAAAFVEKKRVELIESVKERKILDKLKENEYEVYLRELNIAEQKVVDEIVSYRFNNRH